MFIFPYISETTQLNSAAHTAKAHRSVHSSNSKQILYSKTAYSLVENNSKS